MLVKLLAYTVPCQPWVPADWTAQDLVEHAGRLCYGTDDKHSRRYAEAHTRAYHQAIFIGARLKEGHESIVEHVSFTFEVIGVSRACTHQIVRHRLASYSQESQRYASFGGEMVVPPSVASNEGARQVWAGALEGLSQAYDELRRLGIAREDARYLLPNAAASRLIVTMNSRELKHFFGVRLHPAAQWEIRATAAEMLRACYGVAPLLFATEWNRAVEAGYVGEKDTSVPG